MKIKKNTQRLLDIGCGGGFFLDKLTQCIASEVHGSGIDMSENAISEAKNLYPNLSFKTGDALELPFANDTFNLVTSYGVFEHVDNPARAIQKMADVLSVGGVFACMMPTIPYYRDDIHDEGWYEDLNDPPQLQWNYERERWISYFEKSDLNLLSMNDTLQYGAMKPGNLYFGTKK